MFQTFDVNNLDITQPNHKLDKLIRNNSESYFNFETTVIKLYFTIKNYLIYDNVFAQIIPQV